MAAVRLPSGTDRRGKLEIYEPEAQVIRTIFREYLAGKNQDEIAAYMNTLGFPTRDGNSPWKYSTISCILRNERYTGNALLQKRYTTDTLPYQKRQNKGEKQQCFVQESHPAIVYKETFSADKGAGCRLPDERKIGAGADSGLRSLRRLLQKTVLQRDHLLGL